jgi:hypothetical protein
VSDPRLGLPSASSFALDALCPGRQQLLRELGDIPEPVDEDADRGTKLHRAWQLEDSSGLDAEDVEIYERGLKLVETTKNNWIDWGALEFDRMAVKEGPREERFYLHGPDGSVTASGQADQHYIAGDFVLVCDFKSLWCRSLASSELNWQARLLSVLVAREYGATHVRFAFLKALFGKADIVDYTSEDLERAQYSIQQVLWESLQNGAQRRAGAHCRHCKAASGCPEAAAWQMLPSVQAKAQDGGITPKVATELVENISLLDCVKIWESSTARHNIEDAVKTRLKSLPLGELAELGLTFGEARINRPVTDPMRAWSFMAMSGIPVEKLWKSVKLTNGALVEAVQETFGGTKKSAEQWVREKLSPFVTPTPSEKPLEKI